MAGLNENHKRRLLATFQHADELLDRSLNAVAPSRPGRVSRHVQDMSTSDIRWVESYVEKIRDQIYSLLQRFEISLPPPSINSSWSLKTGLIFLDISLEKLFPERLTGYGAMDQATASELTWILQEIRRLLNQLFAFLSDAGAAQEKRVLQFQAEPSLVSLLQQSRESLKISTNRKLQSLRNSILATLESKARRTAGVNRSRELENILRPLYESLEEFTRRWETKFERISDCMVDALKNAAVQMARGREPDRESKQDRPGILTECLLRSVMSI
jgi:hypothetical protein